MPETLGLIGLCVGITTFAVSAGLSLWGIATGKIPMTKVHKHAGLSIIGLAIFIACN